MHTFFFLTLCSIPLLVAETLLRSIGLTLPLLGLFFAAASFRLSLRMTLGFALVFGVSLDFVMGCAIPWSGLLLPLLTLFAAFLHGKRPDSSLFEILIGASTPLATFIPRLGAVFTSPDMFASLAMACLVCAFLFPLVSDLVRLAAFRLKIGVGAVRFDTYRDMSRNGGS